MARLVLEDLAHTYRPGAAAGDGGWALRPLDHAFEDGGAYALLGPSGCGKTTLLNILSGLLRPSRGRVLFDGRDVTALAPARRNIAQVFQFPVVYDTMTVFDNLAFPLRNRGLPEAEVKARVAEVAGMLELTAELPRRASNLGADGKQKISLGRGLVRDDVAAILFDEPLTVIDPHLKYLLRRKLKEVHHRSRQTLVYVTHDQNEALTFADRVVVMEGGRVLQEGTPRDLFERPAHRFVGFFIGSPGMNFLAARPEADGVAIEGLADGEARLPLPAPGGGGAAAARAPLEVGVRPEFLGLHGTPGPWRVPAALESVEDLGDHLLVAARVGGQRALAKLPAGAPVPAGGGPCWLGFPEGRTRLYADGALVA